MKRAAWALVVASAVGACGDNREGVVPQPDARLTQPDADASAVPRAEAAGCRFDVPASLGLAEGIDYTCGDLVVEENRATHAGRVRVHFIRFKSNAQTNRATIYLDGGPGGDGQDILDFAAQLGTSFLDALRVDGDFLVIGQRGTARSVPYLNCFDSDSCSQNGSIDTTAYNTAYNADDVEDLRATLGFDQLNVYGISYGSRLGLEVLRRHGDHIRAALIEGIVPAQVAWPAAVPSSFYGALSALQTACTDAGACGTTFGDLKAKFIAGVNALNAQPLPISTTMGDFDLDGYTYASLTFQLLYSRSSYAWLPLMISDFAEGRADRVEGFISAALQGSGTGSISYGMYYAVLCGELFNPPDFTAVATLNAGTPQEYIDLMDSYSQLADTCSSWPKHDLQTALAEPVTSNVRTLVSSGRMDPITPPTFAETAAATLSDKIVVVHEGSGHGATLQTPCGMQNLAAFLATPTAAIDTSCAASITVDFNVPGMLTWAPIPAKAQLRAELALTAETAFVRDALHRKSLARKNKQ